MINELTSIADELHRIICQAVPKATTVAKYGGMLHTSKPAEKEGQFCGVFLYKTHVQLAFSKGTLLDDPLHLLTGTGKLRRHINFKTTDDIDSKALSNLLKQAAKQSCG